MPKQSPDDASHAIIRLVIFILLNAAYRREIVCIPNNIVPVLSFSVEGIQNSRLASKAGEFL